MIHKARVFLIELGKMLPFVVCFVIFISYAEDLYAISFDRYVIYDGSYVLYKPISWYLGSAFEYNLITVSLMAVISVAVETCFWNKIGVGYALVQLGEKSYFPTIELYPEYIYAIIAVNLLCSGFFVFKGITILFGKNN